jgi:hypothetical protein
MAEKKDIHTLHRYFLWETKMKELFLARLEGAAEDAEIKLGTVEDIETFHYMSYWYAAPSS